MSLDKRPSRSLGFGSGAAVVVASMIGVGVFTTSGFALADLGSRPRVLAAWILGGLLATCGALSYGTLAKRFPESGGEYHFLAKILHPMAGFLAGWVSLLAGFAAPTAAAALGLQAYLAPSLGTDFQAHWIATAAILITSLQHGFGVTAGVRIQNTIVALKLLGLFSFLSYGAWALASRAETTLEQVATTLPAATTTAAADAFPFGAFAVSLVWISFSYSGWNAVVYIAGEIRDPQRNLQRSLVGGCLLVTALYLALNTLFLYAAPVSALAGQVDIAAIAAEHLGGRSFQLAVRLLIGLALLTSISAMMMIGPRVYARMAEDHLFPQFFRARNGNFRHAILLQGGLALCVVWSSRLSDLLGYIGFTLGLSAAATVFALMWQRHKEGADRLRLVGYPYVPLAFLVGVLGSSGFLIWRSSTEAMWGVLTVASGLPIYFLMRRSQENTK
jgi:APA family basic amino acid/polyamine antiporter